MRNTMEKKVVRDSTNESCQVRLHVLGAAGDVTGSLNLFEYQVGSKVVRFIVDCGIDQTNEEVNHQNRFPPGITAANIDFIVVSHAHIDHSGFVPAMVKAGFKGPVYTTPATAALMEFLLADSGHLQEDRARRANRQARRQARSRFPGKKSKFKRSLKGQPFVAVDALYTEKEAKACMKQVRSLKMDRWHDLVDGVSMLFTEACHILGAAVVSLRIGKGRGMRKFCFSGNIGRPGTPILKDLAPVPECEAFMCEATYGNKLHSKRDRLQMLAGIITRAYGRAMSNKGNKNGRGCGVIIIPAFAVGRVQSVLFDLRQLMAENRIPTIPVFVDSPMANRATAVHRKFRNLYNQATLDLVSRGIDPFATPKYKECQNEAESDALDKPQAEPIIIVASSGMAAGGRILQHLQARLPYPENTVLFVGYQGTGTLGKDLVGNKKLVHIHRDQIRVRAGIEYMSDYSGHADYNEILAWLRTFKKAPARTYLVHGEPEALAALKGHIEKELGWKVIVPHRRQCFTL